MLLFIDGMGHYDTALIDKKWTSLTAPLGAPSAWSIAAEGRFGNCIQYLIPDGDSSNSGQLTLSPAITRLGTWIPTDSGVCGFALKVSDLNRLGTSSPNTTILAFPAANNFIMFDVELAPGGTFVAHRWDFAPTYSSTTLQISSEGLTDDTWAYVEFKWKFAADPDGFIQVRVNGTTILDFSGDTLSNFASTTQWNRAYFLGMRCDAGVDDWYFRMCDFYIADLDQDDDDDIADFVGDTVIDYITSDGVGNSSEWTPSAGSNWENVDDVPPNGDTDYNSASAATTRDTYTLQDITGGDPVGVQVVAYARKESEGSSSLQPVIRIGSTDYDGVVQGVADTDYTFLTWPYDISPATDTSWTEAEVNAAESGPLKAI